MKNSLYLKLLVLVLLTAFSCKKETDPCAGITQANAEFQIQSSLSSYLPSSGVIWYEVTKMYGTGPVRFDLADKSCDSVWWKIGNDPRIYRDKTVDLNFGTYGKFEVSCVVFNNKSKTCLDKDAYDTIVKSFEIIPPNSSPSKGRFKGYFTNDPTMMLKEIYIDSGQLYPDMLYIKGFPDTSCDYSKIFGTNERFNIWDGLLNDHSISIIQEYGLTNNSTECDCLEASFGSKLERLDQVPAIFWSNDFNSLKIRFWKRTQIVSNPALEEVWFNGVRVK